MNGHQAILNMRRHHIKPAYVWLQDSGIAPTYLAVTLSASDNPKALDMRFLMGTTVLAESDNPARLACIRQACVDAGAKRVIANLHQKTGFRFEIIETTDTDGVLTWLK